jgi:phosphoribosylamine---glycine ligase
MVVAMASEGYPGSYKKGTIIRKLEEAETVAPMVKIFHAGTGTGLVADGNRKLHFYWRSCWHEARI